MTKKKEVFSAGFSAEKSASEPLTKDDIICDCEIEYGSCSMQCTTEYVELDKMKSALEEFENNMLRLAEEAPKPSTKAACELSIHIMKKAFPAIYEKEKGDE